MPADSTTARTGAAGDDARTGRGGPEQHLAGAEVPDHVVRDGRADQRDLEQVLARLVVALADRLGHLVGLAEPDADVTGLVAHDDERREAEAAAALDDLRDAVDVDDALLELLFVDAVRTPSC